MPGAHFVADAALALRAWERSRGPIAPDVARAALAATAPPGRMEWRSSGDVPVLLDVAHNPAAVERLVATLARAGAPRWTFVAGFLADKRWTEMLDALLGLAPSGRLCGLETANPGRRLGMEDAAPALNARPGVRWSETVGDALDDARADVAAGAADAILVTGSFHTVGEALVALGLAVPGRPYEPAERERPAVSAGGARR
jgi:dihydrofolate synthase/folylpolyglutamate synthase